MAGVSARVENAIALISGIGVSLVNVTSDVVDISAAKDANAHMDFMSQPDSKSSTDCQKMAASTTTKGGCD